MNLHLLLGLLSLLHLPFSIKAHKASHSSFHQFQDQSIPSGAIDANSIVVNSIPPRTRAYWIRQANLALTQSGSACPFAAFGTVIVNHTGRGSDELGDLICTGINLNSRLGNPTLHGEITAITNCTSILTSPTGPYNLSASQTLSAFTQLSLYTNAESCPMCASAIRWSNFREYVYGTSIAKLIETGWGQIRISSYEVFEKAGNLPGNTVVVGGVLTNETDGWFGWQYDMEAACPEGCGRSEDGMSCVDV